MTPWHPCICCTSQGVCRDAMFLDPRPLGSGGVPAKSSGSRSRHPPRGRGEKGASRRGRRWGVVRGGAEGGAGAEGWRGAGRAPAFRRWRCGVGGGLPGALSLKGRRKPRARPHLQSKLGGQGSRLPECGGSRVGVGLSGCGPLAPSCSRRPPPPAASPLGVFLACSLSSALSSSLSFFPAAVQLPRRRRAPASQPAELAARLTLHSLPSPEPSAGPRAPEPPPLSLRLGRRAPRRTEQGCPPLPTSLARSRRSSSRPPRDWRRLGPGGRQLLPAASRTPGGSAPGSDRSVRAARRGPGSGHREKLASGRRLPAPPARAGAPPSPRRRAVSCGPRGTGRGDRALRPLGHELRRGLQGSGMWPLTSSRARGCPEGRRTGAFGAGGRGTRARGSPLGAGAGCPTAPRQAVGQRLFRGPGGKCLCAWGCFGFPRLGGRARAQVGAAASERPLCGEAGRAGARAVLCPRSPRSPGGRAAPASRASAP